MDRAHPSVPTAIVWAYWDLFHVLRTLWRPALVAFAILTLGVVAILAGPRLLTYDAIGQAVARQGILVGLSFLLTPFFLAVHRFVLLGEVPARYHFDVSSPRFQLFCGWLAVGAFLLGVPSFLETFTAPDVLTAPRGVVYYVARPFAAATSPSLIVEAARLAIFMILQNSLMLFPAAAVDAPGAAWQNAIRDTSSRIWFALALTILPFVPAGMLGLALAALVRIWIPIGLPTLINVIAGLLWLGAVLLVAFTLGAVIASRLYQFLGDKLNQPLPEP